MRNICGRQVCKGIGQIKRRNTIRSLWRSGVGTRWTSGTRLGDLPLSALEEVFQEQEPMSSW